MSSDATDNTMRAEFEACIPSFWSRARAVDSEGDSLYTDDWVQGAWIGYQAGRADAARQVAEAVAADGDWYALPMSYDDGPTDDEDDWIVAVVGGGTVAAEVNKADAERIAALHNADRARSTPATGEKL